MVKIFDFKCTFENNLIVDKNTLIENGIEFPDAYLNKETIVKYAKMRKNIGNVNFVELPFCHTCLAEAYGGIINYGDEVNGPRVKEFAYKDVYSFIEEATISFDIGRILEYLMATRELSGDSEDIVYEVEGPLTILNNLVNTSELFKTLKKNIELIEKAFNKIEIDLYEYIKRIIKNGARYISIADPSAGVNILGSKMLEEYINVFAYRFIKNATEMAVNNNVMILLCPKLTLALYNLKKIRFKNIKLEKEMKYFNALKEKIGKVFLIGQMCIKNRGYVLSPPFLKELEFI